MSNWCQNTHLTLNSKTDMSQTIINNIREMTSCQQFS